MIFRAEETFQRAARADAPIVPRIAAALLAGAFGSTAFAQSVDVRPVSGASAFGFAVVEPVAAPLPADLWRGSGFREAEAILGELRIPQGSRVGFDLVARAIASPGSEPADASPATGALRMQALYALGRTNDVARGLGRIRSLAETPIGRRLAAELKLLAGDDAAACSAPGLATGAAAPGSLSPAELREERFSARLRLFCAAFAGDGTAANAAAARLKALGGGADWAEAGANRLLQRGPAKSVLTPRYDDAVDFRLVNALALDRTVGMISRAPLALLRALLDDPKTPPVVRAAAIERALRLGLLSGAEARAMALAMAGFAPNAAFLRNRTLLLDLAAITALPAAMRGEALANALIKPRPFADFAALSALLAPELAGVRIDTGNAALGAPLARAALAIGDVASAQRLLRIGIGAGGVAKDDPDIQRLTLALALASAGTDPAATRQMLISAVQARFDNAVPIGAVQAADALRDGLVVAGAAGLSLAELDLPADGLAAAAGPAGSGAFQRVRFGDAVRRGAKAETALLAGGLGDRAAELSPGEMWAVLSGLGQLGLDREAATLGVEWLLAGVKL